MTSKKIDLIKNEKFKSFDELIDQERSRDKFFKEEFDNLEDEYNLIKEIIRVRKEANLTQKQLSKITGIDQANLSKLENGKLNPSFDYLDRIAKALGKNIKIKFE